MGFRQRKNAYPSAIRAASRKIQRTAFSSTGCFEGSEVTVRFGGSEGRVVSERGIFVTQAGLASLRRTTSSRRTERSGDRKSSVLAGGTVVRRASVFPLPAHPDRL